MPSPWAAETGERLAEPEAVEVVREREVAAASRSCSRPRRPAGRRGAGCRRSPRRRGAGRRARRRRAARPAASASAARAWSWIETASGSSSSRSTPPVSISVKRAPVPVGRELLAVARDARALVHDRLARLREAVDERGLADVRDSRRRRPSSPISSASTTSVTIWSTTSSSVEPGGVDRHGVGRGLEHASAPRSASRSSRSRCSAGPSRRRRRARRRGGARAPRASAVRNTLTAASGATTVPMSRPSATQSPSARIACCLRTSAARTRRVGGDARRGLGDLRRADLVGHVAAVEQDAVAEPRCRAALGHGGGVASRSRGGERDGAVHRARVEVREAEPLRDGAGDRGLAGPGGAVDGDDHSR